MIRLSQLALGLGALGLLLYPLWGLLFPESYALELEAHYAFAEGATDSQVRKTALIILLSNGTLAAAFLFLAAYISCPGRRRFATAGGILLLVYPFVRTAVEAWGGLVLTAHAPGAELAIEFSTEKLIFIAFGLAMLGVSSAVSRVDRDGVRKPQT